MGQFALVVVAIHLDSFNTLVCHAVFLTDAKLFPCLFVLQMPRFSGPMNISGTCSFMLPNLEDANGTAYPFSTLFQKIFHEKEKVIPKKTKKPQGSVTGIKSLYNLTNACPCHTHVTTEMHHPYHKACCIVPSAGVRAYRMWVTQSLQKLHHITLWFPCCPEKSKIGATAHITPHTTAHGTAHITLRMTAPPPPINAFTRALAIHVSVAEPRFPPSPRPFPCAQAEDKEAALSKLREALQEVKQAVSKVHGVRPHDVVLVSAGTIEKTTSGKIARYAVRTQYLEGTLAVEARL